MRQADLDTGYQLSVFMPRAADLPQYYDDNDDDDDDDVDKTLQMAS